MNLKTLTNKIIWITGASSGIGEALAYALAGEGSKLVLSSRNEAELLRVKNNCKTSSNDILLLPFDLQETSGAGELAKKVIEKFGRIDILINNGGISQRSYTIDTSTEIDRKIMEVNFFGTIALAKAVLPYMIKEKSGHIVVVSSIAGKFGFYLRSAYSAAKHALHGFFESLRMEVHKNNIQVLIVCPEKVKTNISLNALTAKGTPHGIMDKSHEQGVSAEECAHQIIKAIKNNKEEIYIGHFNGQLALFIKRIFPGLFSKLIRKQKQE